MMRSAFGAGEERRLWFSGTFALIKSVTEGALTQGTGTARSETETSKAKSLAGEAYSWMLTGSFFFTCMGVLTFELGGGDGPDADWRVIALFRSAIAFAAGLAVCLGSGGKLLFWNPPILWLRSLAGSGSMVCTFFALTRLPPPEVMTLTNTYPIWIGLFSILFLREWPGYGVLIAALVGVAGVALVQQPHGGDDPLAVASALGASWFTALAMMGLNRLKGHHPWAIVAHFSGVATVTMAALLWIWPGQWVESGWEMEGKSLAMLVGVGLGATLGQWCLTQAFTKGVAVRVSIVGLSQVCFSLLFDWFLFGRSTNAISLLGMFMVILPTAWIMSQRKG